MNTFEIGPYADSLPRSADVVVIGGGSIGAATAYYLAQAGVDVTLLERGAIGSEASGANAGFTWVQTKNPGVALELSLKGAEMYETLSEELDFDIQFERCGGMVVCQRQDQFDAAFNLVERQRKAGVPIDLLDAKQAKGLEPALSDDIVGVTYCPLDGKMYPLWVPVAFAQAARRHKARICQGVEVTGLVVERDKVEAVVTKDGRVATNRVVNAAGSWAAIIGQMAGVDLPIEPRKITALITEPTRPLLKRVMLCGLLFTTLFGLRLEKEEVLPDGLWLELLLRQTHTGNIYLGATLETNQGHNKAVGFLQMKLIARHGGKIIPALSGLNVMRVWSNFEPMSPDSLPILEVLDSPRGYAVCSGHTANGMLWGPISGKLMAQMMTGVNPSFNVQELSLKRFNME